MKLINENMKIKAEIDSVARFSYNNLQANRTRIKFDDIDYIVLPLTMFKQFHIQFDANNNIISFYTTDKSILEVKTKKESN